MFKKVSDQLLNLSRSLSGTPSMRQITNTGRGNARWVTRSAGRPRSSISSMSWSAIASMAGRSADIRFAVNHLPTMRRHRSWPSALSAFAIGLLKMPSESPAATRAASGEASPSRLRRGSASAAFTSRYRVSSAASSPLGNVTRATGHVRRSSAHCSGGSSAAGAAIG